MATQALNCGDPNIWLIDSGCPSHMASHLTTFAQLDESDKPKLNWAMVKWYRQKVEGQSKSKHKKPKLVINVLYIPELSQTF